MTHLPRLIVSIGLGALLPLGFLGGLLRGDALPAAMTADMLAFHIIPPALLFVMMASAVWILLHRRYSIGSTVQRVPIALSFLWHIHTILLQRIRHSWQA
jgi:hypothetical protein